MTDLFAALTTAFLAGLLGSAHCLGMCGGISGLFAMHSSVRGLRRQLPMALIYNAGRLASYMVLGFAIGMLGSRIGSLTPAAAGPVRLVAGVVIILIGLQMYGPGTVLFDELEVAYAGIPGTHDNGTVITRYLKPISKDCFRKTEEFVRSNYRNLLIYLLALFRYSRFA